MSHAEACTAVAARFRSRWLRHYVASKLRNDPVFAAAGDLLGERGYPILDLGCGVGLLALYLQARGIESPVTGLEVDARKVEQARALGLNVHAHDVSAGLPEFQGEVVLLDVLHYLSPERQVALLHAIALRIAPGGMLLLRDAPRDGSLRFRATYLAERFAQLISWNIAVPLHFPTRETIHAVFGPNEFTHEERPMYGGTPFNNTLFIFQRVAAPAAG